MNGAQVITPFALVFMLVSMASVTLLVLWCFVRILSGGRGLEGAEPERTGGEESDHDSRR